MASSDIWPELELDPFRHRDLGTLRNLFFHSSRNVPIEDLKINDRLFCKNYSIDSALLAVSFSMTVLDRQEKSIVFGNIEEIRNPDRPLFSRGFLAPNQWQQLHFERTSMEFEDVWDSGGTPNYLRYSRRNQGFIIEHLMTPILQSWTAGAICDTSRDRCLHDSGLAKKTFFLRSLSLCSRMDSNFKYGLMR